MKTLYNISILIFCLLFCKALANDESHDDKFFKLKWDHGNINLDKGRDIVLVDASSCMIIAPVFHEKGIAKYDTFVFSPNKTYYWMLISRIQKDISVLNYGKIDNREIDASKIVQSGSYVSVEGLDASKKYYLYKISGSGVDSYFFHSEYGVIFIKLEEKIRPGKYLMVEKQEEQITSSKVFEVLPNVNGEKQTFNWSEIGEEKLGFDITGLREYSEVSALCNLFYREYRNSENSVYSYSHGYKFTFDEKK